jgi:hypothetical protein
MFLQFKMLSLKYKKNVNTFLHGCETWNINLREGNNWRVLRTGFRGEYMNTGRSSQRTDELYNEECHSVYS